MTIALTIDSPKGFEKAKKISRSSSSLQFSSRISMHGLKETKSVQDSRSFNPRPDLDQTIKVQTQGLIDITIALTIDPPERV